MSEDMKIYAKKILDPFKQKIMQFFKDLSGEKNVLYLDFLKEVEIHEPQTRVYDVGIPLKKSRKNVNFEMESIEYKLPLAANLKFDDFPIEEAIVRFEFPPVLYGPKGRYPKIIISATLAVPWPGEVGLVWTPTTGSEEFAFHPYQDRENKVADLEHFYSEEILDPLCDFLNNSDHILAQKLRESINSFLSSKNRKFLEYKNPFIKKRKANKNVIEVPLYCEFFDENEASILYFEYYTSKGDWLPPADVIVNIMQYFALATEIFDYEGQISEELLEKVEKKLGYFEEKSEELAKKKRRVQLKEEWDPFAAPKKQVKRDSLGYKIEGKDAMVSGEDHEAVLEKVDKMRGLVKEKLEKEAEKPTPPKPEEGQSSQEKAAHTRGETRKRGDTRARGSTRTRGETRKRGESGQKRGSIKSPDTAQTSNSKPAKKATPDQLWKKVRNQKEASASLEKEKTLEDAEAQPKQTEKSNPKEWFNENKMRQFITVGNGNDLPFRKRGDFTLLKTLPKPFILTFARDQLKIKKRKMSSEVIKMLFELYKSGHIKPAQ
ncbi:MAG: hypothetical protein R6U96_06040 [Promethearchaeia archaeon]